MGLSLDVLLINLHDNNRVEVSNNVITELVTNQFYISKINRGKYYHLYPLKDIFISAYFCKIQKSYAANGIHPLVLW